jgi:hypothetical protein
VMIAQPGVPENPHLRQYVTFVGSPASLTTSLFLSGASRLPAASNREEISRRATPRPWPKNWSHVTGEGQKMAYWCIRESPPRMGTISSAK